jgi:hypothetical protein
MTNTNIPKHTGTNVKHEPLTPEQIQQVEEHAEVLTQKQIAHVLGVTWSCFQSKLKTQEGVHEAYTRGRTKAVGDVSRSFLERCTGKGADPKAQQFFLEAKAGWTREPSKSKLEQFERLSRMKQDGVIDDDQLKRLAEDVLNGHD